MTKSHAKSHVKDGPLRRKDVAIWKGGVGSNFVGPDSRFARLRGADPWRHGRGRVCLRPMDSDDRKCPSIVVYRCISLRQKLQPHGGMAARNYRKPSTSTLLIDVYLCAKNFNLMEAWPPGTIRNHRHRHSCRDRLRPRLRTETSDRDSRPRLRTETRDLRLKTETRDKILHFWWFPGLSQNLRNPVS